MAPNLISSGDAGAEEVGDGRVRLGRHRVGRLTGRERAAGVRVHVAVVAGDGVDHPLRDLRAARAVEEDRRPAVLLPGEGRELGPQGVDIEGGHRDSGSVEWLDRERTRLAAHPGAAPRPLRQPAEPDRREPGPEHDQQEPCPDQRERHFLALLGVADARLEVVVDARQLRRGRRVERLRRR